MDESSFARAIYVFLGSKASPEDSMKWRFSVVGPFVVLALYLFAMPIHAQTAVTTKTASPHWYDITKEVTLTGTVSSVVKRAGTEMKMMAGSHLIVETTSGTVDASLGGFALRGKGALSVSPGQRVQVTGVMKNIREKEVFVTRLVQVDGHVYTIRNEHGFVLAPVARERAAKSEEKGGQL
jgi:DNA/RNA endonuclease YhcR with UshA esterase domain